MRFIRKTVSIVCGLIIIIALGGYIFVRNFDLNHYKPYIEDLVLQETGRVLKMNGDAKLGISLVPTVKISDVTFANPDWAATPYMARFANLEVKFAIMPLLHKQVQIDRLILKNPEIYLEESATGQKNWVFSVSSAPQEPTKQNASMPSSGLPEAPRVKDASAALAVGLIAKKVEIKDGIVSYYDAKSKTTTRVDLEELSLKISGNDDPIVLSVKAKYDKQAVEASAEIETLSSLLAEDKASFSATVKAMKVRAVLAGSLEDITGKVRYALEANVHNPSGNFGAPETSAVLRVDGDADMADVVLKNLAVATNEITGQVKLDWSKAKPFVKADLASSLFDLRKLAKTSMLSNLEISVVRSANALEVVPNEKIPYSFLKMLNGTLALRVGKLVVSDELDLRDVKMSAVLQNNILKVDPFSAGIGGGKLEAKMTVNASQQTLKANVNGTNIKLQEVHKPLATSQGGTMQILSGGNVDLAADLSSKGATWRALSENLDGQGVVVVDKSRIKTGKLDWLTDNVFGQILSMIHVDTSKVTEMDVTCAVVRTDFKNGVATFPNSIVFDASDLKLIANGTLNLRNDGLDFTVAPTLNKLAEGNLTQALAGFVKLRGTIRNPKVRLDTAAAVTTVVGAVVTSGASLGADMLFNGNEAPCYTALQGTKYASKFSKPTGLSAETKDVYNDTMQQTKEAVQEIGDAAKSLFKSFKKQLKGE